MGMEKVVKDVNTYLIMGVSLNAKRFKKDVIVIL